NLPARRHNSSSSLCPLEFFPKQISEANLKHAQVLAVVVYRGVQGGARRCLSLSLLVVRAAVPWLAGLVPLLALQHPLRPWSINSDVFLCQAQLIPFEAREGDGSKMCCWTLRTFAREGAYREITAKLFTAGRN